MKKIFLIILTIFSLLMTKAQQKNNSAATILVTSHNKEIGLTQKNLENYIISDSYNADGIQYVYILQSFKSLPIRNQMKVLAFRDDKLLSKAGNFIDNVEELVSDPTTAGLNVTDAVKVAFEEEKLTTPNLHISSSTKNKFDFGKYSNVSEKVTGELIWMPIETAGKIKSINLIWSVVVAPKGKDDIWEIFVDAKTGKILGKQNFTVYENFDKKETIIEKKIFPAKSLNLQKVEKIKFENNSIFSSPTAVAGASYLVIPYPAESPVHPGGTAAVRSNPWTPAVGNASTLGWHSDGTNDYTISRGNNVWATEDRASSDQNTGLPAVSTTVPDPLTFNFPPNYSITPTDPIGFQRFATTNLFYWNNIMHDISYQYGFNEPAGNFQKNNLGRGGNGGDDVIALAQSGTGTNNANFSTPVDGGRPRMRMYLFDAAGTNLLCRVNTPSSIGGDYVNVESGFSTANKLQDVGPVTAQAVWFDDASGTAHEACGGAPTNVLTGKIAIINRGTCSFVIKALAAQAAGAVGIVMINNAATAPIVMGGTDNTITIPAVMVSQADGAIIAAQVANNLNITLAGIRFDGDLDNGIIAHEFGHGISTRLTGGPGNSSCLGSNAPANNYCGNTRENGSEGWSDFFGLMVSTNWATALLTDGALSRSIGTYANGQTPTGAGFRIKPYSTNTAINNETYANVGDATYCGGIHNIGEVWCTAIWEMTWAIINQEGVISPNLYDYSPSTNAGNIIAMKLVMEGLKLQPCTPGFVDQRDAILAADRNLYAGRHACAMWTAFAKRGLGYGANQGSSNSVLDQTASTALPPAPTIVTQPIDLNVASGANAPFTASAGTDVNLIYTWQVSTNGGSTWANVVPAVITPTLTLNAVTTAMNNNKYRCIISIGCATTTSDVATLTVTGVSVPAITLSSAAVTSAQVICNNSAIVNIVYTTSGGATGATVSGLPSGVTGVYSSGTFTISGTATTAGNFNYTVTTSGGTSNATAIGSILVNAASTIGLTSAAATTNQTVNVNTSIVNITYSTTNGITGATVTGLPAGVSGTYSGGIVTISGNPTVTGTFSFTITSVGGCGTVTATGTITVSLVPSISLSSAASTANQTVCINNAITNITYTTAGGVTGASVTGLPTGVTGSYSAGNFTISGTPTATGTFNYTITTTGGTTIATATGSINVSAASTISLTSLAVTTNQTVTVNSSITNITYSTANGITGAVVTGLPTGVTGVYTGGTNGVITISGTPTVTGSFNYTITTSGGCGVITSAGTINVVNGPSILLTSAASTSAQTLCITNSITNIVYTGAGGITGVTVSGLPAGVTGIYSGGTNGTFTISGTPTVTGIFNYTVTTSGGSAVANSAGSITINTASTLVLTSAAATTNQSIITNTVITNITYSTTGGVTGATITGLPTGVTGVYSGGTNGAITISGTPTIAGTFNYTVTTSGGCSVQIKTGTISVVTPPSITLTSATGTTNQTICVTSSIINITYSTGGGVTGATVTGLPLGVIGTYAGGTNGIYTISGSPTGSGTFNYTITTTGAIVSASGVIAVVATPAAPVVVSPLAYCQNSIALPLTATGTNLLWYTSISGGTGTASAPIPSTVLPTTYFVSQSTSGCESPRASLVINILPTPTAPASTSPISYCQGSSPSALTATGTNIKWYISATATTPLSGAPTPLAIATGSTSYFVSQTTGICESPRTEVVVNITSAPSITTQPQDITSCATTAAFTVVGSGSSLAYQWFVSTDAGVTFTAITSATSSTLTLTGLTVAQSNYKYRCVVSSGTCTAATSNSVTAKVGTPPVVVLTGAPVLNFNPYTNGGVYTTVSPVGNYSYKWTRNNSVIGNTAASITKANGLLDDFGAYQVTVTDLATNCSGISNIVTVADVPGSNDKLFASPNPTNGIVNISYYSSTIVPQARGVRILDSKGAKLITQILTFTGRYGTAKIDLSPYAAGTYFVTISDANGTKLATQKIVKY